ncbi:hypothetical protein, partial [Stenotrophomonas maltophilia]|uniref:hypothetical protein n=1 Tax=Stenotrophomonas maltophilia TaxID=40324 RepID=UPI00313EBA32
GKPPRTQPNIGKNKTHKKKKKIQQQHKPHHTQNTPQPTIKKQHNNPNPPSPAQQTHKYTKDKHQQTPTTTAP